MTELKKGDKVNLTSGGHVTIEKELGRGGQGIVYLVDLNGEESPQMVSERSGRQIL